MTASTRTAPAAGSVARRIGTTAGGSGLARWRGISTEIKILLALVIGLSPIGMLGVYATLKGNEIADRDRVGLIRVANTELSRKLGTELAADRSVIRRSLVGIPLDGLFPEEARRICSDIGVAMAQSDITAARIYIVSGAFSRELCPGPGSTYLSPQRVPQAPEVPVEGLLGIDRDDGHLLSSVRFDEQQPSYAAVLSYSPEALLAVAEKDVGDLPVHDLAIVGRGGRIDIADQVGDSLPGTTTEISHAIGRTGYALEMTTYNITLSRTELVSLVAPLAIWILGAFLSWGLLSLMIMRPLSRLHRSVAAYRPGAVFMRPRYRVATAREIVQLEQDFSGLSETVAADKAELAKGLQQQMALTREVHHRVKNNLQIIASLINLHSRSAEREEAQSAYRTIQRRIDAIAVVHRNHLAGGEDSLGHSLQPLISELATNLRASGTRDEPFPPISVASEELYVTQDTAVPIAFMVTEIAELSALCGPTNPIAIRIERSLQDPALAQLSIQSDGLIACASFNEVMVARYERIVTGLSRQLRRKLDHQQETGIYTIDLPVSPPRAADS